ncbi:hypothetical protein SAMN05216383_1192 [Prevotella sp. KH2C16]|nr:hypothetical protein SAMN05216383_1192 [Prevotella sp. KH2C16]
MQLCPYYRIQNVGSKNYVEVRGRATADASVANADKFTKPGTVLLIGTEASSGAADGAMRLTNLRSQGLDVIGDGIDSKPVPSEYTASGNGLTADLLSYAQTYVLPEAQGENLWNAYNSYMAFAHTMFNMATGFADAEVKPFVDNEADKVIYQNLMDDFNKNYLPKIKLDIYLVPAGAANTYYVRSQFPSLKPIKDFYTANKAEMDRVVCPAVRKFMEAHGQDSGEGIEPDEIPLLQKLGYTFPEKYKTNDIGDPSYHVWYISYGTIMSDEELMFYWVKMNIYKLYNSARVKGALGSLLGGDKVSMLDAFANKYFNEIHYNVPYFLIAGSYKNDAGQRSFVAGNDFGFANDGSQSEFNDLQNAGDYGKWVLETIDETNYFTVKPNTNAAKNGMYYASTYLDFPFEVKGENVNAVYTVTADGIQSKNETDGSTTKYVEFEKASGIIPAATAAVIEFKSSAVDNTLSLVPSVDGTRAGVGYNSTDLVQGTFLGGNKGDLNKKWGTGVNADSKLYLWGYNKSDTKNPYGFYLYSNETIPTNKPFIQTAATSGAKIYFMIGGETTGINGIETGATISDNAPRYNLNGQRVGKDYKGVVIVEGKKIIQK